MANYNEINENFCQKKITSIKDNSLAVKYIFEFLKCFINKLELKDYKSLVIINENKVIGFDLNDDFELKELIKLYLGYSRGTYEIKFAIGLGQELIDNFIEFTIKVLLQKENSTFTIPNLKSNDIYGRSSGHNISIKNNEDNTPALEKLADKLGHEIYMFVGYGHIDSYLGDKIITLYST